MGAAALELQSSSLRVEIKKKKMISGGEVWRGDYSGADRWFGGQRIFILSFSFEHVCKVLK